MTVSIVPSTGIFDGLVGARRPAAERLREHLAVDLLPLAEHAATAPHDRAEDHAGVALRAPSSPRAGSPRASCASVVAVDCSSASTIPRIVSARFVPVSPSGTG